MDNGTSAQVIGQFDRIAALPDEWDHNRLYQREILDRVGRRRRALDLGCGTGELTRALAVRCAYVVGVDASSGMVAEARRRNWGLNIDYVQGDAEAYLRGREGEFDFISSVAAFHHMDEERMLLRCKEALAPGGTLVVLDLFEERGLVDLALSALAAVLNPFYRLAHTGQSATSREERELWAAHSPQDHYKGLGELRDLASRILGEFSLERKLFWRYMLVYQKPALNPPASSQARRRSAS
jgi:2-polyprenyl-3-methyl-5-hydroxy-6-metoxy-1,4-benzoquinol methylase